MVKVDVPEHLQTDDWVRMPRPGGRLCGLSRTTLLELESEKKIRSVVLRKPGAVRGIRLIHLPSLHAFLESLES
jgi:hypothetical protein